MANYAHFTPTFSPNPDPHVLHWHLTQHQLAGPADSSTIFPAGSGFVPDNVAPSRPYCDSADLALPCHKAKPNGGRKSLARLRKKLRGRNPLTVSTNPVEEGGSAVDTVGVNGAGDDKASVWPCHSGSEAGRDVADGEAMAWGFRDEEKPWSGVDFQKGVPRPVDRNRREDGTPVGSVADAVNAALARRVVLNDGAIVAFGLKAATPGGRKTSRLSAAAPAFVMPCIQEECAVEYAGEDSTSIVLKEISTDCSRGYILHQAGAAGAATIPTIVITPPGQLSAWSTSAEIVEVLMPTRPVGSSGLRRTMSVCGGDYQRPWRRGSC